MNHIKRGQYLSLKPQKKGKTRHVKAVSHNLCHAIFTLATCKNSQLFKMGDSPTFSLFTLFITPCFHLLRIFAIKKIFMSPNELVDENDPSTWVAKTKVAPVKFTK